MLPFALVLVFAVVQVGLGARDQLLVTHAAREGARRSAVTADVSSVRAAVLDAVDIDADRLQVDVRRRDRVGGITTVRVTLTDLTEAPIVGSVVRSRSVSAEATMLVEARSPPSGAGEAEHLDSAQLVERLIAVAALR